MAEPRIYEFRCPVHGFIELDDWEREIVQQPAFQRLRRIRQLAWTEYVSVDRQLELGLSIALLDSEQSRDLGTTVDS